MIALDVLMLLTTLLTSCEYFVDLDFVIQRPENDTITLVGWGADGKTNYTSPYTNPQGWPTENTSIFWMQDGGGPSVSITREQAFTGLQSRFDSVRITRRSDGASTITYRHDDNATEAQRYFFKREAWDCDPEGEELKDRIYTFKLTDDMFH